MMGHKICFNEKCGLLSLNYRSYPVLFRARLHTHTLVISVSPVPIYVKKYIFASYGSIDMSHDIVYNWPMQ